MRAKKVIAIFIFAALCGCGKKTAPASAQTATLTLKDGTTVTGTVMKSDTSSITVQSANGVLSTYPMTQVSAVNYGPPPESAANTPPPSAPPESAAPPPAQTAPAPPPQTAAAPPPPPAREYHPAPTFRTIPAGTTLEVRNNETIDSQAAAPGQTFSAVVVHDVDDAEGRVAIPRGANATLIVRSASGQGKIEGRSDLVVDIGSVEVNGRAYRLESSNFAQQGKEGLGGNKRTAIFTGGGGALGTILGAVAGGGKGAAIGALSGAAAGAATQSLTRGKAVRIPAETVMSFRLEAPIRIREMR